VDTRHLILVRAKCVPKVMQRRTINHVANRDGIGDPKSERPDPFPWPRWTVAKWQFDFFSTLRLSQGPSVRSIISEPKHLDVRVYIGFGSPPPKVENPKNLTVAVASSIRCWISGLYFVFFFAPGCLSNKYYFDRNYALTIELKCCSAEIEIESENHRGV